MDPVSLRPLRPDDLPAVQRIYAHHVRTGLGTFEETPPGAQELVRRCESVRGLGLPWTVAETGGEVLGYAYAGPFRLRAAYRYTVEDSVYVAPHAMGRGVGAALLNSVVEDCERLGLRQMVAVIGDSGNMGSVGLHRACGFEFKAALPGVGFKFGRWVDVVWMQRPLNAGADSPPDAPGLTLGGG
jgi:L-amino acid N-acyltransferase YncA